MRRPEQPADLDPVEPVLDEARPRGISARAGWLLALGSLASAYALPLLLQSRVDGWWLSYAVRPLLWLGVAAVAIVLRRRSKAAATVRDTPIVTWGYVLAVAHVGILVATGVVAGFGKSPYDFAPLTIALNLLFAGSMLCGTELVRSYLVSSVRDRFTTATLAPALVLAIAQLQPQSLLGVSSAEQAVSLAGGRALPAIAEGLLASVLSLLGGAWASVTYRGVLEAFRWFSPVLPDTAWYTDALVGTLVPVLGLTLLVSLHRDRLPGTEDTSPSSTRSLVSWVAVGVFAVLAIWFATGALGPRPLVIASQSMSPSMQVGDIAIVGGAEASSIAQGDVIAFTTRNGTTVHRVLESREGSGQLVFITKGDANDSPDSEPVVAPNLRGRVILVIPKVGWLAIAVKRAVSLVI